MNVLVVMSYRVGVGVGIGVDFHMLKTPPAHFSTTRYTLGWTWAIFIATPFDTDPDPDPDAV